MPPAVMNGQPTNQTEKPSIVQNTLINYHPFTAWGLTTLFIGLAIFYVIYVTLPLNNLNRDSKSYRTTPEHFNKHYILIKKPPTRLANVIFTFVSGVGIGHRANRDVLFSREFVPLLQLFPLLSRYMKVEYSGMNKWKIPLPKLVESGAGIFEEWMFNSLPDKDIQICCYLQSYKYFQDIESELREVLVPDDHYLKPAQDLLHSVKEKLGQRSNEHSSYHGANTSLGDNHMHPGEPVTFVGVHVRRGDMATEKAFNTGRITAPLSYIKNAMKYMQSQFSNIHYIFCSDDINWCKAHFSWRPDVSFSDSVDSKLDLTILSQCNHSIMTVGTFGWWGSWLAGGQTVYYEHQNVPTSHMAKVLDNGDFFPPYWIPMS